MNTKNPPEEIEVIRVTENFEEHYYREPYSNRYRFYPKARIPLRLFQEYIKHRSKMMDYRMRIRNYFQPIKDKKQYVAKYHE